jgi:hypothetical protein
VTITTTPAPGMLRPLTAREIDALRSVRSELSEQLSSAVSRRRNLAQQLDDLPADARQGVLDRIGVLDARIVQLEKDIALTGQQLTAGTTLPPPEPVRIMGVPEETFFPLAMTLTLAVLMPIALAYTRLLWKRATAVARAPRQDPRTLDRMERLEQAVDAVAIEIERVGEAQRFQGRMLAEAQIIPGLNASPSPAEPVPIRQYEPLRARDETA